MLETANCTSEAIYPLSFLPSGDDHKRKPFHVVHCMAQPPCSATLRLSPGGHSRLSVDCVVKFAGQKGWFADRKGYALCPIHKPGAAGRPPSDMSPAQKRAAFLAIRDRDLAAAAGRKAKPAAPVGDLAKRTAELRARMATARAAGPELVVALGGGSDLYSRMAAFIAEHPNRVWSSRRDAAKSGEFNIWTFNDALKRAIAAGLVVQEPIRPPASRPFRLRVVDKFDPPALQPEPMESAMSEATVQPPAPPRPVAEPPRQATREHNRLIRDYLDANYDEEAGRYRGDLSDDQAAKRLSVPRAWVTAIRSNFYGDDRNESDELTKAEGKALVDRAAALEAGALDLATKAESLGRDVRRFLEGKART